MLYTCCYPDVVVASVSSVCYGLLWFLSITSDVAKVNFFGGGGQRANEAKFRV